MQETGARLKAEFPVQIALDDRGFKKLSVRFLKESLSKR
jgi:hypothetical protein